MKQSALKIGESYRLQNNYGGKGDQVVVLDTGWEPAKGWSAKSLGRKVAKGGTHVAVAKIAPWGKAGEPAQWIPAIVPAFKIVAPIAEADVAYEKRNNAAREARIQKEQAEALRTARTQANIRKVTELVGGHVDAHYVRGLGNTGVVLTNAQVEQLLALLDEKAAV